MTSRADLEALDHTDALRSFRDRFVLADGLIYLDGNSLGALPRHTAARLQDVITREWGQDLITSWNRNDWIGMGTRVGDKIGRLVGAAPGQVVCADSTSINVFKLVAAAVALRPGRTVVLSDRGNFPTDLYMVQGFASIAGRGITLKLVEEGALIDAIDDTVACVLTTEVNYRTGWRHDMAATTRAAHAAGAIMLWDLAHSAGAFPVALDAVGADLAVGCGYKYLNGGPGAPAFLYVASRHQATIRPPLSGWLGHDAPFAFDLAYRPAGGIQRNICGTPPVLSMAALECGVDIMLDADMAEVRRKSVALADLFHSLVEERLPGQFRIVSPREADRRGSQVCLAHEHGYAIVQALIAAHVIPDFRAPDILRFGLTPLYVRYVDIWDAVDRLREIMAQETWRRPEFQTRAKVT